MYKQDDSMDSEFNSPFLDRYLLEAETSTSQEFYSNEANHKDCNCKSREQEFWENENEIDLDFEDEFEDNNYQEQKLEFEEEYEEEDWDDEFEGDYLEDEEIYELEDEEFEEEDFDYDFTEEEDWEEEAYEDEMQLEEDAGFYHEHEYSEDGEIDRDDFEYLLFEEEDSLEQEFFQAQEFELGRGEREEVDRIEISITKNPTPGKFYQIKKGDNLLKLAGKAFGETAGKKRILWAQYINNHILNKKFWTRSNKKFTKKYFPGGIISFLPKFHCNLNQLIQSKKNLSGNCYATIYIPKKKTIHFNSNPENILVKKIQELETKRSKKIKRTTKVPDRLHHSPPYLFTCFIDTKFILPDGNECFGKGTGVLISPRHVLTAAHNLFHEIQCEDSSAPVRIRGSFVNVVPALHGSLNKQVHPIGFFSSSIFDIPIEWEINEDYHFDFGLIDLGEEVSSKFWGSNLKFKIKEQTGGKIRNTLYSLGYNPADIKNSKRINLFKAIGFSGEGNTRQNELHHDIPIVKGMSGGPIWTLENKAFNLIGINSNRVSLLRPIGSRFGVSIVYDYFGLLLTRQVLERLREFANRRGTGSFINF